MKDGIANVKEVSLARTKNSHWAIVWKQDWGEDVLQNEVEWNLQFLMVILWLS